MRFTNMQFSFLQSQTRRMDVYERTAIASALTGRQR